MAVNKIDYFGTTLIDLTADTVTPETLAEGITAHDKSGEVIVGTMKASTEDLNAVLTEQEELIAELQAVLAEKTSGGVVAPIIEPLEITENGTYIAPDGVDGYSPITVNVQASGGGGSDVEISLLTREITAYSNPTLTTLGSYAFSGTKVTSLDLPALTQISAYSFYNCTQLANLSLPKLTEVPTNGFREFGGLVKADFSDLSAIKANGFYKCAKLETLIIRSNTLCTCVSGTVWTGTPILAGTGYIYVPAKLVESYKVATNWSAFASQFRAIEDYPEICGGSMQ